MNETNINHCGYARCADCGCQLDEEDAIEIDGEIYCRGCCHWCDRCDQYVHEETHWVEGYGYVCETCLERDFMYCEVCESYEMEEEMTLIECEDRYVCDDCLGRYYSYCEDCGEYYPDDEMNIYGDRHLCETCYDARVENENNNEDENEAC
jgi:formylmethanofuran dehydrogenase subunit E